MGRKKKDPTPTAPAPAPVPPAPNPETPLAAALADFAAAPPESTKHAGTFRLGTKKHIVLVNLTTEEVAEYADKLAAALDHAETVVDQRKAMKRTLDSILADVKDYQRKVLHRNEHRELTCDVLLNTLVEPARVEVRRPDTYDLVLSRAPTKDETTPELFPPTAPLGPAAPVADSASPASPPATPPESPAPSTEPLTVPPAGPLAIILALAKEYGEKNVAAFLINQGQLFVNQTVEELPIEKASVLTTDPAQLRKDLEAYLYEAKPL